MRPLQEPRRGVLSEGAQEVLPVERLPVRELSAGGGETARDGCSSRTEETASDRGQKGNIREAHTGGKKNYISAAHSSINHAGKKYFRSLSWTSVHFKLIHLVPLWIFSRRYRPVQNDPFLGASPALPPPLSDRMRKRRAFADKELETIMLEREYKERELLESSQSSSASLFLPGNMVHAAEYNSYKTAFSSSSASSTGEPSPKDLCGFLPGCLDLSLQYAATGGTTANMELISSNVSVAATYRQYPLSQRFVMWPRGSSGISDALLYQQCLLNATAVQNLKPGAVWDPKMMTSTESHPPEQEPAVSRLEGSRVAPEPCDLQPGPKEAQTGLGQSGSARSAFSPPKRVYGQAFPPHAGSHEHVINNMSKDTAKHTLSMKLNSFHSLIQQTLNDKNPEKNGPYCKELLEEAAKKFREGTAKDTVGLKSSERAGKDLVAKPWSTKVSAGESLSFSVEAILKRPALSLNRTSQ
ncbi:doublesex- and mab-3-related transcription factor 2-like isoform X2 [Carassius auratus]|uniref:Doublesex- and mab-3-related transcription factor 2-like isoform X2 n=1 Tax=Carassius auratus TaxID=7957 RepID=A0A6P6NCR5_CARAU|nr:doublesex- and mab-3-related transcription factor 2-like isoform X2 [Carassius auratus]